MFEILSLKLPHSVILVIPIKQQTKLKNQTAAKMFLLSELRPSVTHEESISGILKQTHFFTATGNIMLKCVSSNF